MRVFPPAAAEPPTRPNAEIARDFLDLAFELENGRQIPVFSRFEGPITVRILGAAPRSAETDLARLLDRLRREARLDITRTRAAEAAITINFLPRRAMRRMVPKAACFVVPRIATWDEYVRARRATLDWTTVTRRERAAIFIPSDTAPQEIRDCLHEELAQALGPLNDLFRLPDSVFNDDNIHTVLTGFDMLILRAYYAPELQVGMTRGAVAARLPGLLARLNPAGERGGARPVDPTPRAFVAAIETALGPGSADYRRVAAAHEAVQIATEHGWRDARAGFAWLAYGRLALRHHPERAGEAFRNAEAIYRSDPVLAPHTAHVDLQLAALALGAGRPEIALDRTGRALPIAMRAENAALLASLMMIRAAALEELGRASEARQVRLDSLGWARYGFGSDDEVRDRLRGIATLAAHSG
ncbi:DUF2927 domain-containing protein [Albidovulum sp.]